jgi:hypothetical protein
MGTLVWKDANGQIIPDSILPTMGSMHAADSSGYFWKVDYQSGAVIDPVSESLVNIYYVNPGCTGAEYMPMPLPAPRIVFATADGIMRVQNDNALSAMSPPLCSILTQFGCSPDACISRLTLAMGDTTVVPSLLSLAAYQAPFHPEFP